MNRRNKIKLSLALSLLVAVSSMYASPLVNNKFIPVSFFNMDFGSSKIVTSFTIQNFSVTPVSGFAAVLTNVPSSISVTPSTPNGYSYQVELIEPTGKTSFEGSFTVSYSITVDGLSGTFSHVIHTGPDGKILSEQTVGDMIQRNPKIAGCLFDSINNGNPPPKISSPAVNRITNTCFSMPNPF